MPPTTPPLRVALIDDNPDDRRRAAQALRLHLSMPIEIIDVVDQASLDALVQPNAYDVAMMDEHLAWADGMSVLRFLKQAHPDQPVLFLTHMENDEATVRAMQEGADDYIVKDGRSLLDAATVVRLALERASLRTRAREALRLRDSFLAMAAHELRTPLTALLGYTQMVQRRVDTWPAADYTRERRALAAMERQAALLARLVDAMLDATRMDQPLAANFLMEAPATLVDLHSLLTDMIADFETTLTAHTITLSAAAAPLHVQGDSMRLEQVLQHLLNNAVKYCPMGGPITVRLDHLPADDVAPDGWAALSVTDAGIGIPPEALPYIFERFYRASNVETDHLSGLGLGLPIAHLIVVRHGGTISVQSALGQGSTFTVRLPLTQG